jgi:hypothetical protein
MTLVVEDGTGKPDAEAYISVIDADAYFAARGKADWAALDDSAKEAALRNGSDYMAAAYGQRWRGCRASHEQALDWPRHPFDAIPKVIGRANAELALRSLLGDLMPDEDSQVTQEVVGPLSVTYAPGARQAPRFAFVDNMLAPCLSGGVSQIKVSRA